MADKKWNYSSQRDYIEFIKDFPSASAPTAGAFYVQTYMFTENPDFNKLSHNKKKTYDFCPVNLCLGVSPSTSMFMCLNWHMISVNARKLLLNKLIKVYPKLEDLPRARIPGMNYSVLISFLRKAKIGIRKYKFERVIDLRYVPGDKVEELMMFHANFYYASNYKYVESKYNKGSR